MIPQVAGSMLTFFDASDLASGSEDGGNSPKKLFSVKY
jgi:hypothetical protein